MESIRSQTKKCPFCAEDIQAQAVKCRFCGEFLGVNPSQPNQQQNNEKETQAGPEKVFFRGRPSLWGMAGSAVRGLVVLILAGIILFYPVENLLKELFGFELTENQTAIFVQYRTPAGLGLAGIVIILLSAKIARLKSTSYEVTCDRVEWERGIFSRKIDNLDMFRVIDLKLRRSLLDCILGIGTVELITTDKTDPQFTFEKIRRPRTLYDILKKASLDADRRSGVIHLE